MYQIRIFINGIGAPPKCLVQVLWECGGTLAAPAIAAGVIHKALAFIAPKLVSSLHPGCLMRPAGYCSTSHPA